MAITAALLLLAAVLAVGLMGCGASAIRLHARALTVATVAIEGVDRGVEAYARAEVDACVTVECVDVAERAMITRLEAADVAVESTRAAILTWAEGLRLAVIAGEDGDVMAALLVAAARLIAEWQRLSTVLGSIGLSVPPLPNLVLSLGAP